MKKLGKAIDKLCSANIYGTKISDIREDFIFIMFVKTVSDLAGNIAYDYISRALMKKKVVDAGVIFKWYIKLNLPAFLEYKLPQFNIEDRLIKDVFKLLSEFNFSDQLYLDNDYVSFAYQRINSNYFKGSADSCLADNKINAAIIQMKVDFQNGEFNGLPK